MDSRQDLTMLILPTAFDIQKSLYLATHTSSVLSTAKIFVFETQGFKLYNLTLHHHFIIISSSFHHHFIIISSSFHHHFIIISSSFHHHFIIISSSIHHDHHRHHQLHCVMLNSFLLLCYPSSAELFIAQEFLLFVLELQILNCKPSVLCANRNFLHSFFILCIY